MYIIVDIHKKYFTSPLSHVGPSEGDSRKYFLHKITSPQSHSGPREEGFPCCMQILCALCCASFCSSVSFFWTKRRPNEKMSTPSRAKITAPRHHQNSVRLVDCAVGQRPIKPLYCIINRYKKYVRYYCTGPHFIQYVPPPERCLRKIKKINVWICALL